MVFAYRPGQEEAIRSIIRAIESGKRTVFLHAETGSGKSIILTHVARHFAETKGWRTYYTTPLVSLVDQISTDNLLPPNEPVYGKSNNPCAQDTTLNAEDGWCMTGIPCARCGQTGRISVRTLDGSHATERCPECRGQGVTVDDAYARTCPQRMAGRCEYYAARDRALSGRLGVMTMAYFNKVARPKSKMEEAKPDTDRFGPRDLLIIDEADNLAEVSAQWLSLSLSRDFVRRPEWGAWWDGEGSAILSMPSKAIERFEREELLPWIEHAAMAVREALEGMEDDLGPGETAVHRHRKRQRVKNALSHLMAAVEDLKNGNPWVVEARDEQTMCVTVTPVASTRYLKDNLWPISTVRILASGTFLGRGARTLGVSEMGLDPRECFLHVQPPVLPPSRAPIVPFSPGAMNYQNRETMIPLFLSRLERILNLEPNRGIVHARSYANMTAIREHFSNRPMGKRLVFHTSEDRNDSLDAWLRDTRNDVVLVCVNFTRGLDLKDDLARWQVSFKCPYPSLSSRRVQKRLKMPDGEEWYRLQALREELQLCGRTMRSMDDWSNTYLLDLNSIRLFEGHIAILPSGLKDRYLIGKRNGRFTAPVSAP